jgi:farnesyl-diphosphate farnesyltransferase
LKISYIYDFFIENGLHFIHLHFSKKQGAYGKIVTHKEPIMSQLCHVDEVLAAISFLYLSPMRSNLKVKNDSDMAFCEKILVAVSRSFAAVIRQLPTEILKDVAVFYLVLRALDTVEDDMVAFESNEVKCRHLLSFHETALVDPSWNMDGVGHGDEKRLLQDFPAVHRVYKSLSIESQVIISDVTARMAAGMAEFVGKDLGQGTIDVSEYNRYCHFVAGLVGEGLSRIFASSSFESDSLAKQIFLSNQMGLFLQKTNIIRDFLEDYVDKRAFWPQSIWKKYSITGELGYFCNVDKDDESKKAALSCLNELVADALELVPDCLSYMACLRCSEIFRFCAIPQVMALSTLEKLYNNSSVFTGVVKIRKGLACKLMQKSSTLMDLHEIFYTFSERILIRCKRETEERDNPEVYARTVAACEKAMELTYARTSLQRRHRFIRWSIAVFTGLIGSLFWTQDLSLDFTRATLVILLSLLYWLSCGTTLRTSLKSANLLRGRSVV